MLTIKQVKSNGSEQIWEIKSVEYESHDKNQWKNRKLILETQDGLILEKSNRGLFFVMNEKGHTVGKYFLGPDEDSLS